MRTLIVLALLCAVSTATPAETKNDADGAPAQQLTAPEVDLFEEIKQVNAGRRRFWTRRRRFGDSRRRRSHYERRRRRSYYCGKAVTASWYNWGSWGWYSAWGSWGGCDSNGNKQRYRSKTRYRSCNHGSARCGGSTDCGTDNKGDGTDTQEKDERYSTTWGSWSNWSNWGNWGAFGTCSSTNGRAYSYRTRSSYRSCPKAPECGVERYGRIDCPSLETDERKNTDSRYRTETRNCQMNAWSDWSTCTKSCGTGSQKRSRTVRTEPKCSGTACPHLAETRDCNTHVCPADCVVGGFSSWSTCTKSCASGFQSRSRALTQPQSGGKVCPHATETRTCNHGPCPVHCATSAFSGWSACTKSCGTGTQGRSRTITKAAQHGGYVCPYLKETRTCNEFACAINCISGRWSAWSTCTKSCGGGSQRRGRPQQKPALGGEACPHNEETRACNGHGCPVDCVTNAFGAWSTCTTTCGTGSQKRSRTQVEPTFGGKACPHYEETRGCNTHACIHLCSHTTCSYVFMDGAWRTNIKTNKCNEHELHGTSFHCEHHFGTQTVSLGGTFTAKHTNECACYCDHSASSTLAHHHSSAWDASTDITSATPDKHITHALGQVGGQC